LGDVLASLRQVSYRLILIFKARLAERKRKREGRKRGPPLPKKKKERVRKERSGAIQTLDRSFLFCPNRRLWRTGTQAGNKREKKSVGEEKGGRKRKGEGEKRKGNKDAAQFLSLL